MKKIRVAIADDHKIYRDGLKVGLSTDENFELVLEADNGEELLQGQEEKQEGLGAGRRAENHLYQA